MVQMKMHRGLLYWPKTGVVYDANADYICPPYTGPRGDNLDNKPQTYGGHMCLWAVWLLGETVANIDRLVVCRAAPDERTPTYEGSPRVTGYFPQFKKTLHGYQYKNKISLAQ